MTRRILALPAVVVALLVAGAAPALADFHLVSSVPAAGSTVLETPGEVKIIFDQPVNDVASSVQVTSSGSVYNDGVVTVEGGNTLVQPVRRLSSGNYSVSWTAASGPGAPSTAGKFGFTVSAPADRTAGTGQWIVVGVLAVIVAALGSTLIRRRLDRRNATTDHK